MARLIIFTNGLVPNLDSARRLIQPGDVLVAADGGSRHVLALGMIPSVVIGDLDSITPEERQWMEARGVIIRPYPRDKDQTDLELALEHAIQAGYREILIVGALGGRLDQTLGNLALISGPQLSGYDIRIDDGVEEAFFLRSRGEMRGRPGEIVSLLPWGEAVTGINTEGLRWPLHGETLLPDRTRGISNEMLNEAAGIEIASGLLLCIHQRIQ